MNLNETDIAALENYWQGKLTNSARTELENRLTKDKSFREAAANWQLLIKEGFMPSKEELAEAEQIKSRLLTYEGLTAESSELDALPTAQGEKKGRIRYLHIALSAAAAILLLVIVSPYLLQQNEGEYASFFEHLPRDNANLSTNGLTGEQAYDEKKYVVAYPKLLAEVAENGDSLNIIYAGVAAIGSQQGAKAITLLKPLVDANNWQLYQSEIQWYLALAYLQEENKPAANLFLTQIIQTNNSYTTQANELLKQIK